MQHPELTSLCAIWPPGAAPDGGCLGTGAETALLSRHTRHLGAISYLVSLRALRATGAAPESGCLGTDTDGAPLLLLHSRAAQRASVLRLPQPGAPGGRIEVCAPPRQPL